jgi:hypothetical protein
MVMNYIFIFYLLLYISGCRVMGEGLVLSLIKKREKKEKSCQK